MISSKLVQVRRTEKQPIQIGIINMDTKDIIQIAMLNIGIGSRKILTITIIRILNLVILEDLFKEHIVISKVRIDQINITNQQKNSILTNSLMNKNIIIIKTLKEAT